MSCANHIQSAAKSYNKGQHALVLRNTIQGNYAQGMATAASHGLAVALYAVLVIAGIGLIMVQLPWLFQLVQWLGIVFLAYLAFSAFRRAFSPMTSHQQQRADASDINGWRDGFLIAFLNPKLAIFFIALFSQFIDQSASFYSQSVMVLTVGIIDWLWYSVIVQMLSVGKVNQTLKRWQRQIELATGLCLLLLIARVLYLE